MAILRVACFVYMIARLEGQLLEKNPASVLLNVNGVGYELQISLLTFEHIRDLQQCVLFTHLVVNEDAHTLYGFATPEEKKLFKHLISVNGVGPNTARMILSSLQPEEIMDAIIGNDIALLTRIKGVGPKSAQRLVLELQDKLKKEDWTNTGSTIKSTGNQLKQEAVTALTTLGFARAAAEKAIDKTLTAYDKNITLEELIKVALKQL